MMSPAQVPAGDQVTPVDIALWDLKAKLLGRPLLAVLPAFRDEVPVYGSGGFTNYPLPVLTEQFAGWAAHGIPRMKLKTSRDPGADPERLTAVRPDPGRPGLGLAVKWPDLEPYRVYGRNRT
jgi:L-alanine-DL-glutamate epimerase-like enolase superfamily enzyme